MLVAQIDQEYYQQDCVDDGLHGGTDFIGEGCKGGIEHGHAQGCQQEAQLFIAEPTNIATDEHGQKCGEHDGNGSEVQASAC